MAVALTLAVNIAIRKREEEMKPKPSPLRSFVSEQKPSPPEFQKVVDKNFWKLVDESNPIPSPKVEEPSEPVYEKKSDPVVIPNAQPLPPVKKNYDTKPNVVGEVAHVKPGSQARPWENKRAADSIRELTRYYQDLIARPSLTDTETFEKQQIENLLKKHGWLS